MLRNTTLKVILFAGVLNLSTLANAQTFQEIRNEAVFSDGKKSIWKKLSVNLSMGLANYGGDLQEKGLTFKQAKFAIGGGVSYEIVPRLKLRGEYIFSKLTADDKQNSKASLRARNLNFTANLFDLSLTFQYDLFDIERYRFTPYIFAGAAYFKASPYTYVGDTKVYLNGLSTEGQGLPQYPDKKQYSTKQMAIPFGLGFSYKLSDILSLSFEGGIRKTFTDYIDDVSGTYADFNVLNSYSPSVAQIAFRGDEINPDAVYPAEGTVRGNSSNKDYYYFGLVKLNANLKFLSRGGVSCPRVLY